MNDLVDKTRVLVVDDEDALRRAFVRGLSSAGFEVTEAASGAEALRTLEGTRFDVIVSDITMPGLTGVDLLRAVRERDLDVPVILVTGNPTIDTATAAVEYGALRYLLKPVNAHMLAETVGRAAKLQRVARLKREAVEYLGNDEKLIGDRAGLEASLARGIDTLWMAFQPIVSFGDRKVFAYEALVRTREASLPHPGALFSVAERLGRVHEVGRAIRASVARTLAEQPQQGDVFINLHPSDLLDASLFAEDAPLAPWARQIVLEVTERVALDSRSDVPTRVRKLRERGYRIAIDDLGAGYAGLSYFTLLSPDVVKLDIALIRNVQQEAIKQKLVGSLTTLCRELGMRVVAEGIETAAERDTVVALGGVLLQGYLFAKPASPFPAVAW
jgi:EAL domain-containing protein (putative c-di-GMP-specific phosphodiesterase class I)